jgi:DNA-directed RNA polymerase subunit RPC12/RpoP
MPIKIINKEPDKKLVKQCTCRNCGALLEYMPVDTFTKIHTDYTGDTDTYTYITCPNCNYQIIVG